MFLSGRFFYEINLPLKTKSGIVFFQPAIIFIGYEGILKNRRFAFCGHFYKYTEQHEGREYGC